MTNSSLGVVASLPLAALTDPASAIACAAGRLLLYLEHGRRIKLRRRSHRFARRGHSEALPDFLIGEDGDDASIKEAGGYAPEVPATE